MRTFESSESYKIQEKSKEEEEEYEKLNKRVKNSKSEKIDNDITNDLLGSIVYKKMLKDYGLKKPKEDKRSRKRVLSPRGALYVVISLVALGFIGYRLFRHKLSFMSEEKPDKMTFEDGSKFENVAYFGKEDLIIQIVSQITKIVHQLRTLPEKELTKSIETTQKNFLFHGAPGTGKTLFMQRLVYLVDLNLRYMQLKNEMGDDIYGMLDQNKRLRSIKARSSLARITFVRPSILNSKFVGETEKNINLLFEAARSDEFYWATFIFIDEVDVFFSKREDKSQDYALKSQTEFLNIIGGACDKLKTPVFLFGATNLYDSLDPAFVRRFSGVYKFDLPNEEERREILEKYLCDCRREITDRYEDLVKLTKGMAQSKIVDVLKKLTFTHDGKAEEFTWSEVERRFEEASPERKGAEGNKIRVDESLKKFYFLDPPKLSEKTRPKSRKVE